MKTNKVLVAGAVLLVSAAAQAQNGKPTGFDMEGFKFHPGVGLKLTYDDNIYQRDTGEVSSWVTTIFPTARFIGKQGASEYRFGYEGEKGIYQYDSADNYFDHKVYAATDLSLSSKLALSLSADHQKKHDDRGSTDRADAAVPDEYDQNSINGVFRYGAKSAKGRFELAAGWIDKEYTNNRVNTEESDYDELNLRATYYHRIMPKTSLLFEIAHKQFDYDLATSTQDSEEMKYYVGATWDATAKTTGTVKIGFKEKDFDSSARNDVDSSAWSANVRWSPKTYSVFDFTASKDFAESTGVGNVIDSNSIGVAWIHNWSNRFSTNTSLTLGEDTYRGDSRVDDTTNFVLGANYKMQRWLTFGSGISYDETDSNIAGSGYDRSKVYLSLLAEL